MTVFTSHRETESAELSWRTVAAPDWLVVAGGDALVVAPPPPARAYVNGRAVVVMQTVVPGDLVRIVGKDGSASFVLRADGPKLEKADGRLCRFTGLPITGADAVVCTCGAIYAPDAAAELGTCPVCRSSLSAAEAPPEELL